MKTSSVTEKGKAAGRSLKASARKDERRVEAQKGSALSKGEKRFRGAVQKLRRKERRGQTTLIGASDSSAAGRIP
jgi:hypothetical protein